jgi:hypothetical protein
MTKNNEIQTHKMSINSDIIERLKRFRKRMQSIQYNQVDVYTKMKIQSKIDYTTTKIIAYSYNLNHLL